MANVLNVFSFPLHGQRLIEASAGTGKTFTIAGLYLRLLLGHGDKNTAHQAPLTVDRILVVTFTDAATQELKDRIRKRIHQARKAFERGESDDPILATLLKDSVNHKVDAKILLDAERQMDEASIYTIHSFCQRMLKQNAFESGSLFIQEVITDQEELKLQATSDFWRREFYRLDKALASIIQSYWACPKVLLSRVSKYLSNPLPDIMAPDMPESLATLHQENIAAIDKIKKSWLENADKIPAIIQSSGVNKRSYSKANLPKWLEQITQWACEQTSNYKFPLASGGKESLLKKFSTTSLQEKTPKGVAPEHSIFDEIEKLLEKELDFEDRLTKFAIYEIRNILEKEKLRHSWLSFDDLLSNLAQALNKNSESLLAASIRELYPVAMIDEFQDTDPLQYEIFSTIYQNNPSTGLFMIGDPKQAIYAFRGADIFTYISARSAVNDHYNLDTNWRSSAEMVQAANRLFAISEDPFIYQSHIPFLPVNYAPSADKNYWQLEGKKQPALTLWLDEQNNELISKAHYQSNMAEHTAENIREILDAAKANNAHFVNNGELAAIKPRDIAILVRTGTQASLVKKALAKRGIVSVYLSDRSSVFSSLIAKDLEKILNAVLMPENEKNLRSALACSLFALSALEIDKLNHDEMLWEKEANQFIEYQKIWFNKGVLPMLRYIIHSRFVAQKLLSKSDGERQLTDLMHLGELLQKESTELDSHYALIRWLNENIETPNGNASAQQVRLESERDLVQIVTIHKSKGLEYKLVYLPFACDFKEAESALYHDENHQAVLELANAEKAKALEKAEKERLAEDLRLLYVAITRAIYGCVLAMAPIKKGNSKDCVVHKSAIGYLLQKGQPSNEAGLLDAIKALVDKQENMHYCQPSEITLAKYLPPALQTPSLSASQFTGQIERHWRLSSYSGLVRQGHKPELDIPSFDIDAANEEGKEEMLEEELAPFSSIFQFPKGARPGTFIHTLFENISFDADMQSEEICKIIQYQLLKENYAEDWIPVLQHMLNNVVSTKLNGEGIQLKNIKENNRLNELEFMMLAENLSAYSLNALIKKHDALSAKAGYLDFKTVSGMVKGFIDLIFCFEGKYYVLDWKSNYLGDKQTAYTEEALQNAMIEHRYDFQYQIYTLALHRFLRTRIADYCYEKHIGGVFYLFVRGMQEDSSNGIFHTKPTKEFIEQLDKLFVNGVQHAG